MIQCIIFVPTKEEIKRINKMRISNIANSKGDNTYEMMVIGTEQELEMFQVFTQFGADFIEEENEEEYSMVIMGSMEFSKKEFKERLVAELREFRKIN